MYIATCRAPFEDVDSLTVMGAILDQYQSDIFSTNDVNIHLGTGFQRNPTNSLFDVSTVIFNQFSNYTVVSLDPS